MFAAYIDREETGNRESTHTTQVPECGERKEGRVNPKILERAALANRKVRIDMES